MIKNDSLQLLCDPNMKKSDLINRIKILTLELLMKLLKISFLIPFIIIIKKKKKN